MTRAYSVARCQAAARPGSGPDRQSSLPACGRHLRHGRAGEPARGPEISAYGASAGSASIELLCADDPGVGDVHAAVPRSVSAAGERDHHRGQHRGNGPEHAAQNPLLARGQPPASSDRLRMSWRQDQHAPSVGLARDPAQPACCASSRLSTLPVELRGSSSKKTTSRGTLYRARLSRTNSIT